MVPNPSRATSPGSPKMSSGFMAQLSKLEYILLKAQEVEEDVLESLQALLQTNGILRSLLNILEAERDWLELGDY